MGHQFFDPDEFISGFRALKVPMIALSTLVVISAFANTDAAVKQRVFQAVHRGRHGLWNSPQNHFHDPAILIINSLMEQ